MADGEIVDLLGLPNQPDEVTVDFLREASASWATG
jgi:hypothetical protein